MKELLEYFLSFTENLNLNIQFVVEQLGKDAVTKEVGGKFRSMHANVPTASKTNSMHNEALAGMGSDGGPGGSPQTILGLHSFKNTDSMKESVSQPPEFLK